MAVTAPRGHLLHVGYPKTGSKFLQQWFAAHPDLAFSQWGIAGFADGHAMMAAAGAGPLAPWHVTSHEALLTPLAGYRDLGADLAGLPTGDGQRSACAMLAALFPGAQILIVTRGYEALLRSFYAELVVGGAGYSFRDYCDALLAQVEAGTDPFDVDSALDSYAAGFGEDRLLVLPYELLRDSPDAFLGEIEARLAIRPAPGPSNRVRPSPPEARLAAYRRMSRWVRSVPGPASLRRIAARAYVAALRSRRLDGAAATIERLSRRPDGERGLPPRLIEALAGRSERLRGNPLYRDYARDYLL
jgi:hypothetical protein